MDSLQHLCSGGDREAIADGQHVSNRPNNCGQLASDPSTQTALIRRAVSSPVERAQFLCDPDRYAAAAHVKLDPDFRDAMLTAMRPALLPILTTASVNENNLVSDKTSSWLLCHSSSTRADDPKSQYTVVIAAAVAIAAAAALAVSAVTMVLS